MTTYRIVYEREGCIGAASCSAVHPEEWKLDDENKAVLKNSKEIKPSIFELEIEEEKLEQHLASARACPVNVIHIYNKETGEKLI